VAAEEKVVKILMSQPLINKMDAALSTLAKVEYVLPFGFNLPKEREVLPA
jgi:hypothetical protein